MVVHPAIAPQAGDITCVKRRVSAFTGSDLEVVLRAQDIRHLVLAGVATSGVVLSTVREAGDKDFRITVLSDCCADMRRGSTPCPDDETLPAAVRRDDGGGVGGRLLNLDSYGL